MSNFSIDAFVDKLNYVVGIKFIRVGTIEELNEEEYRAKRICIQVVGETGYQIKRKIDIGVYNKLEIEQEEYCFDIAFSNEGAQVLDGYSSV